MNPLDELKEQYESGGLSHATARAYINGLEAHVAELEREGCGGDPHSDCYVPAAHPDAEEGT